MQVMTREHPRWDEFVTRLEGPDGCNFHKNDEGKWEWFCKGGKDKSFATAILKTMSEQDEIGPFDIPASLAYFESYGGYCDCEIIFNVAG